MVTRVKVPLRNMGSIEKALAKGFRNSVLKAMKIAARQSIPVLSARVWDAPPASDSPLSVGPAHAFGTFLAGWEVDVNQADLTVSVYNKAVHAGWVEKGVRASKAKMGKFAVSNIQLWIERKGIKFSRKNGQPLSSLRMAWIIVAAMNARTGWRLKPRRVAMRARPRIAEIFTARMREAVLKATAEALITRGRSLASR